MAEITPFLWFNDQAEVAMEYYSSIFANSEVVSVNKVDSPDVPGGGFVIGSIRIENQVLMVLNGGPAFVLNQAFSLFLACQDQVEVDYYWNALREGGTPSQCGWITDRFGVTWQVIPRVLGELMGDSDQVRATRVRDAMMTMTKIECDVLQAAYDH